jgi:para-aminobenzoate synthetase component 1
MQHLRAFPLGFGLPPDEALRRLVRTGAARPFLLDGAADADGLGRHSYAGCDPRARFRIEEVPELIEERALPPRGHHRFHPPGVAGAAGGVVAPAAPLWQAVQDVVTRWSPLVAVGLFDYELGRASERLLRRARPHGLGTAAVDLAAYDAVYRYDAVTGSADILAVDEDAAGRLRSRLLGPAASLPPWRCGALRSETSQGEYARRVRIVLEHLRAGDCYQVNLCRRLRAEMPRASALPAYLRLRTVAPAPLGFYIELEGEKGAGTAGPVLLSNSPELLLRLEPAADGAGAVAETRPIKGTRRRGKSEAEDAALRQELCQSEKDRAEHIMIVDLLRNDLGRIAEVGSVKVAGLLRCVELPTVHHLVSTIKARPAAGIGLAEILHALLPGGSITGAPKVAAMALIDELEPLRRGPFYGAVGWLSHAGGKACGQIGGQLALCIRTAVATQDELFLSVGGGIVLDSEPEDEWLETEAKAAAFARALG